VSRTTIEVATTYDVDASTLWEELRHIDRHVSWMMDAQSITFRSTNVEGLGTQFVCRTRIGPFVTDDVLTITEWEPLATMGVDHRGLVSGSGHFVLSSLNDHQVRLVWREQLVFPWWMGGPVGAWVAGRVLAVVWRGNLRRLGQRVTTVTP